MYSNEDRLVLLTYRSGIIPVLPSTYYDSDSGWGCMLRVAQMFVANLLHRRLKQPFEEVVKLFVDNELAPFSIQMLTCVAMRLFNKKNFEWFNPSEAGHLVKDLLDKMLSTHRVSIGNDNCLFRSEISVDRANCIVLLMCRIGMDNPQKEYIELIAYFANSKYFAGILGGRPKYAHLFTSYNPTKKRFRFLDPHKTLKAIGSEADLKKRLDEFVGKPEYIDENSIDPSMCIAFEFPTEYLDAFWKWLLQLKQKLKNDFFLYIDDQPPDTSGLEFVEIDDEF